MQYTKFSIKQCCGNTSIVYKISNNFINLELINKFKELEFIEQEHFTKAGLFYMLNSELILTGTIGSNKIEVKCRKSLNCEDKLNKFEELLTKME